MKYFAYGSNMDPKQMLSRCPSAKVEGVARLAGYEIGFPVWSQSRHCAVGSILPAPSQEVWGVVYEISDADEKVLSRYEGSKYELREVQVTMMDDGTESTSKVALYAAKTSDDLKGEKSKPNRAYIKHFIDGAMHHRLPLSYLEMLRRIPTAE